MKLKRISVLNCIGLLRIKQKNIMRLFQILMISMLLSYSNRVVAQSSQTNVEVLVGMWKIDLSPQDTSDDNFAQMEIVKASENSIKGTFYREGVEMKEGRISISEGIIHAALVSSDNSGSYNTAFYYKDGVLYGTTHSIKKNFLSVWKAQKLTGK